MAVLWIWDRGAVIGKPDLWMMPVLRHSQWHLQDERVCWTKDALTHWLLYETVLPHPSVLLYLHLIIIMTPQCISLLICIAEVKELRFASHCGESGSLRRTVLDKSGSRLVLTVTDRAESTSTKPQRSLGWAHQHTQLLDSTYSDHTTLRWTVAGVTLTPFTRMSSMVTPLTSTCFWTVEGNRSTRRKADDDTHM